MVDVETLKRILESQIEILEDLRDIYENTIRDPLKKNCYNKIGLNIPVLQDSREQIPPTLDTIDKVIEERQKLGQKLDDVLVRVEKLKSAVTSPTSFSLPPIKYILLNLCSWKNSYLQLSIKRQSRDKKNWRGNKSNYQGNWRRNKSNHQRNW